MYYSVFEVFAVGIGPSSSHTVGPMKAAKRYVDNLIKNNELEKVERAEVTLYGSLALTGIGHGTVNAAVYGLLGLEAESIDLDRNYMGQVRETKKLLLGKEKEINFDLDKDVVFSYTFLPEHSNAMKMTSFDKDGKVILEETYFSVGGGTIARQDEIARRVEREPYDVPYQFNSYKELVAFCKRDNISISELVLRNEQAIRPEEDIKKKILGIYDTMREAISRGVTTEGILPGGINLRRRAPELYKLLKRNFEESSVDALAVVDWINTWAFAVAEENAAGGRIVTAPTMGAAGVLPAVIRYYKRFCMKHSPFSVNEGLVVFLTTASAICSLYRTNASISGAEVGCQGEVGVACSMAAGGLAAALGGDFKKIESAAEIGMEHNLGLTCDPIKGLVQVPCIERNAVAAVKAVNAARLAIRGTGEAVVPLDSIIKTMYETGLSLKNEYKETSQAGLAINVIC